MPHHENRSHWIAITAADPRALPFLVRRVTALPFLAGALERHLEEFPDPTSGLSRTERHVPVAIARGEAAAEALTLSSHAIDPRYPLTDGYLAAVLRTLGRCGLIEGAPAASAPATAATLQIRGAAAGLGNREQLQPLIDNVVALKRLETTLPAFIKGLASSDTKTTPQ